MLLFTSVLTWTAIAALAGIAQVVVLIVTAIFVWRYLKATERLADSTNKQVSESRELVKVSQKQLELARDQLGAFLAQVKIGARQTEIAQDQLEIQIQPAIVTRVIGDAQVEVLNIGNGPAIHLKLAGVQKKLEPDWNASPMNHAPIPFLVPGSQAFSTGVCLPGARERKSHAMLTGGMNLQCEYRSLSGRRYATVVEFELLQPHNTSFFHE